MKLSLSLLVLTTALGAANVSLAFTAPLPAKGLAADTATEAQLFRVDSDEDDDEGGWFWGRSDDDDEGCGGDDEGDDGDDEGEGGCTMNGQGNPAPQGSTTPPKNGLFNNGAAPKVITN